MSKLADNGFMPTAAVEDHPMLALLAESDNQHNFKRGDVRTGVVAMVSSNEMLIDVGGKFEGILSPRELSQMSRDEIAEHPVGSEVEVVVVNPNDRNGNLLLSIAQVRLGQDWDDAEAMFEAGKVFESPISGHNKGGLIAYVGQVRGFVPVSQLDRRHGIERSRVDGSPDSPLAPFVTQPLWMKIIEIDRRKNRLILSEQAAMRERRKKLKANLLDDLNEGEVVEGRVTSLADFGAFVDVGGADGLVHLSEISWNRVSHPSEVLSIGEDVEVKVINIDRDRNRIGLSLKQLQPEPWSTIEDRYHVGEVVPATITRLADFGAFARLDGDIEGLIHVSEMADEEVEVAEVLQPDQEVMLRIIRIDPERRRIGLSLKRADEDFDRIGLSVDESGSDDDPESETEAAAEAPPSSEHDATEAEAADEAASELEDVEAVDDSDEVEAMAEAEADGDEAEAEADEVEAEADEDEDEVEAEADEDEDEDEDEEDEPEPVLEAVEEAEVAEA